MNLTPFKKEPIRLSAEGVWFHGDTEVTHARTCELFFKNTVCKRGKFLLTSEKFDVPIQVDDAAFFVRKLQRRDGDFLLTLSDGTEEKLDLTTLDTGPENQLYCRVKKRTLRARFERRVYYDLMKDLVEKQGYYGLIHQGLFYPIQKKPLTKKGK